MATDIIILDPPIMPWVTTEESHNCSSLWQHWINLLCCQGERLLFFYCCEKAQSVLDKMSGIVKPNQSPKKEQSVIMKTWYLINQNMKCWGTWGCMCVWGGWEEVSSEPFPGLPHFKERTEAPDGFRIPWSQILLRSQDKVFLSLARKLGVFLCC